uniref:Uncharacterized protein n=1 Tax=Brassica oleracea TaxID=3712 RepID=A0A3P6EVC0_BRAOL|nr:unnamed protein product [Brassica oleracea]
MTDPYYKEMKHHKREYDWVSNCVYANYKIPTKCIMVELSPMKLMIEEETITYAKILRTMVCTSVMIAFSPRGRAGLLEKSLQFELAPNA